MITFSLSDYNNFIKFLHPTYQFPKITQNLYEIYVSSSKSTASINQFLQINLPITPMKNRGKYVKTEQDKSNFILDSNNFSSSSNGLCKKHPENSSTVGICAYCLSEKLIKLYCSDCGKQRTFPCSCSNLSSYRNSSCNLDVGSVGRISVLIEDEKGSEDYPKTLFSHLKLKQSETEDVVLFKRSSSCAVEVKKGIGFWKIGKFFKKKREKEGLSERNIDGLDQKSDVSRSRSLSSFMGDKFHHEMCSVTCSSAKISDFHEFEPRKSEFKGGFMDLEGGFPVKESNFSRMEDDDEFIDLKIDLFDKSKTEYSVFKKCDQGYLTGGGGDGSPSCQFTVNDRRIKQVKNSHVNLGNGILKIINHILKILNFD